MSLSDPLTLLAKGLLIDRILDIGPVFRRSFSPKQICTFLNACAATALGRCNDIGDKSSDSARELARVLTAGVNVARRPVNVSAVDQFFSWVAWVRRAASMDSVDFRTIKETRAGNVHDAVLHACSARRLFRTESGLLGLGPECMQKDDQLVVLYEADIPCILRPTGNDEKAYHNFVGSCYVYRIMEGEAFQRYGEKHHQRTFKLK